MGSNLLLETRWGEGAYFNPGAADAPEAAVAPIAREVCMELGILIVRLVIGLTLAAHGAQKSFGWFGGGGIAGTAPFLEQLGFRPGRFHAALAGIAETAGGLLLAAGLLTPLAAAALIGTMVVAVGSVHRGKGFFLQGGGLEYNLVLAAGALAVAFTGPGAISLDRSLGISWAGNSWGLIALLLGLVGGAAELFLRKPAPAASTQQAA
jgi:putative oxidoreductase